MLQYVSVYINHHQGAHRLCFAKVTMLISVVYVVNEVFGAVAAYAATAPKTSLTICASVTEINNVTLAKHRLRAP